jgi:hypothetical protein
MGFQTCEREGSSGSDWVNDECFHPVPVLPLNLCNECRSGTSATSIASTVVGGDGIITTTCGQRADVSKK